MVSSLSSLSVPASISSLGFECAKKMALNPLRRLVSQVVLCARGRIRTGTTHPKTAP